MNIKSQHQPLILALVKKIHTVILKCWGLKTGNWTSVSILSWRRSPN